MPGVHRTPPNTVLVWHAHVRWTIISGAIYTRYQFAEHMLVRAASTCMLGAFAISKIHNFRVYWHAYGLTWRAAHALLASEVCTKSHLRMVLGKFDNCADAEDAVAISPVYRAVYAVAEEMHICGNSRCAIFYMDITDRLTYICALVLVLLFVFLFKFVRDYKVQRVQNECRMFELPHSKRD